MSTLIPSSRIRHRRTDVDVVDSSSVLEGSRLRDAIDEATMVGAARRRVRDEVAGNDRRTGIITGGSFVTVMAVWLLVAPPSHIVLTAVVACAIAYAVAASVEFEIGPGWALPTTPVAVVALFLLPPQLVPVVAVAGLALAAIVARLRDPDRRERAIVLVGSSWHAIGPAAVFALAHISRPALADLPVYVLALGAQFGLDAASSWVRNCHGLGVPTPRLAGALRFTFLCDLLLAPIGLAAALALPGSASALLFLAPPTLLLAMLQHDRRRQIDRAIVLGDAFTETTDLARRDVLTGLSNRLAWEEATARYAQASTPIAVVLADVDGLKVANDGYGHGVGDQLLIAVSELLTRVLPAGGHAVLARLGGDEFGILLPGALAASAERVTEAFRAELLIAPPVNDVVRVGASIGVGIAADGASIGHAFAAADRAVNTDKIRRGARRT